MFNSKTAKNKVRRGKKHKEKEGSFGFSVLNSLLLIGVVWI